MKANKPGTIGAMKISPFFVAGTETEKTTWERLALVESARAVVAWMPARSTEFWWADVAYAASKQIPVICAEPDTDSLSLNQPVLALARLRGHMMHYCETLERAQELTLALLDNDRGFTAGGLQFANKLWEHLQRVESPIERRLVCHLHGGVVDSSSCDLFTQREVLDGRYRVDFAITNEAVEREPEELRRVFNCEGPIRIIVETDGHDFHERTKEQAARDKRRDRELQTAGWTVLRFTGSEVWKDPRSCVSQVMRCIDAKGAYHGGGWF